MTSLVSRTWTRRVDFIGPRLQTRWSPPGGRLHKYRALFRSPRGAGGIGGVALLSPSLAALRASPSLFPLGVWGGTQGVHFSCNLIGSRSCKRRNWGVLYGVQSDQMSETNEAMRRFWGESGKSRYAGRQKSTHAEGAYRPEPLRCFR